VVRRLRLIGSFFLVLGGLQLSGCTSLFYYPRVPKIQFYDPSQMGLDPKNIEVFWAPGKSLHAWYFQARKTPSKGTIVHFHGNAENVTTHFMNLIWVIDEGYDYVIFDYPGYGLSDGEPSPKDNYLSAKTFVTYVHEKIDSRPLIFVGQSLGGNILLKTLEGLEGAVPIRSVIVDSTFPSYRSVARQKASESWVLWLLQPVAWLIMSDSYAPEIEGKLPGIPKLVIHGDQDRVVPFKNGKKVFSVMTEPKEFLQISGGNHTDVFYREKGAYRAQILSWLEANALR